MNKDELHMIKIKMMWNYLIKHEQIMSLCIPVILSFHQFTQPIHKSFRLVN